MLYTYLPIACNAHWHVGFVGTPNDDECEPMAPIKHSPKFYTLEECQTECDHDNAKLKAAMERNNAVG